MGSDTQMVNAVTADRGGGTAAGPRIAFVSTYPPTVCGLASYTQSLREAIGRRRGSDRGLDVVSVLNGDQVDTSQKRPEVIAYLDPADRISVKDTAMSLTGVDAVILQHEYGIWGPRDGMAVLDLTDKLNTPLITTLHTVLPNPTDMQHRILEHLVDRSRVVTVPTRWARQMLVERYAVDNRSVVVIPHGTPSLPIVDLGKTHVAAPADRRPTLLTWGLIGPGKGLELALKSISLLRYVFPGLRYTIAGRTHPKVLEAEGEAYRRRLEAIVQRLGLDRTVHFLDEYLPRERLQELLREATVVVLPYESSEQAVSGVLVEAVAAHVPVVATDFPHATELAAEGAVVTVPRADPEAMAGAIGLILDSQQHRERIIEAQRHVSPSLAWSGVAAAYERLVAETTHRAVAYA